MNHKIRSSANYIHPRFHLLKELKPRFNEFESEEEFKYYLAMMDNLSKIKEIMSDEYIDLHLEIQNYKVGDWKNGQN
jgi:hypothetical protein